MTTIAFAVHPERREAATIAERAQRWLEDRGHRALAVTSLDGPDGQHVDLAISLGGDGTILRTVGWAAPRGIPVLGVNLGRLGYLTEVEPAALEEALGRFTAGDYAVERRMMLDVEVGADPSGASGPIELGPEDGEGPLRCGPHGAAGGLRTPGEPVHYLALNEAVVEKTVPGHTVRLHAAIAGHPFVTYGADGLLVATPTGSTAYNLSARGPILSPRLRAMVVTPISPHMLFDRALVLEPDESFTMTVAGPRPAVLIVDGLSVTTLAPGQQVSCRAAAFDARMVVFGRRDFHAIIRSRFGLTDR